MNRLFTRAIRAWQSWRAGRKLERTTRKTERAMPDLARNRQALSIGRRHHKPTLATLKAQRELMTSALRGEV